MKRSKVLVEIDLGLVIDETKLTNEEIISTMEAVDLNMCDTRVLAHMFTNLETEEIMEQTDLKTGLRVFEHHRAGDPA